MEKFHIVGPTRLAGRVAASGAKNAALPALTASLLSDETLTLRRVPRVRDIRTLLKLLDHLGMASQEEDGVITLRRERPNPDHDAPYDLVKTMRASVLVLGPLLAKEGHARVSLPGGCAIGVRPIDQHLKALTALGAEVTLSHGYVETRARRLTGARFRFDMPTVTGTENVLMAASLARGTTVLENCAREPEVIDLANLLNAMGARISGAGEETIVIDGVDGLGAAEHTIIPDRIEGGTYLIGAALTGGDVLLESANAADLAPLLDKLAEVGARVEVTAEGIRVRADQGIAARDLETAPHPGFPTDLQAQYMTLMTCAYGVSAISETIFENRFQHAPELMRMGADIRVDGGRAQVHGPSRLTGAGVMATDLRASACLVLAGIAAEGETVIDRIYHLDRGYEQMELKLQSLGARVARWSVPTGT
ncbi:MAG TPA: UDP-N-acetylglucosamine 1-carboxyvinyltransferase [Thermoanaerobaculia bacterium]|jgi:UDP-N-acetylglucosamine 1-carboxyvinyltransferase|nr:UDP-N-acetylglucosamine 1-carboxyvinyltransferase [Thermoanaerobaculia bacterium]